MKYFFLILLLLFVSSQSQAQEPNCSEPNAVQEIDVCAILKNEETDKQLNIVYQQALEQMKKNDIDVSTADEEAQQSNINASEILRQAQSDWVKFRDSNCEAQSFLSKGATMYSLILNNCLIDMSDRRIKELQDNYLP